MSIFINSKLSFFSGKYDKLKLDQFRYFYVIGTIELNSKIKFVKYHKKTAQFGLGKYYQFY